VFRGRRVVVVAGVVLLVLGVGALVWSYFLAHGAHALAQGWWEGTLQALGVGFVVGGLVDVIAVTGLNRIVSAEDQRRQRLNDRGRSLMELHGDDKPGTEYQKNVNAFLWDNRLRLADLDPDVSRALLTPEARHTLSTRWKDVLRLPMDDWG
jgi:hypothetical protein